MGHIDGKANIKVIDAGDMSGNLTSATLDTRHINMLAVSLVSTGSPNGEYQVLVSENNVDFEPVTLDPVATITASGNYSIGAQLWPHSYTQIHFEFSSGTGALNAWVTLKRA